MRYERDTRARKQKSSGIKRPSRHRGRMIFLQVVLLGSLGVVAWRIEYVQHVYGKKLLTAAATEQDRARVLLAPRGALLDSSGHPIAYDVPAFMMDIDISSYSNLTSLATIVGAALKVPETNILNWMQGGHGWIQWRHPILETAQEQILNALKAAKLPENITFTPTELRFYPYGQFAANTIGYVANGIGATGLEAEYNKVLSGTNGSIDYKQDAIGFPIPGSVNVEKAAMPGDNVETTINQTIQGYVEQEMNEIIQKYHPDHAAIIVANPQTGAILAMSSRPTYDPNQYWLGSSEALSNNWAVNSAFEPGSTFKPVVLAAGLATNTISLNDTFHSGAITVDGSTIHDWNYYGWGDITFRQALEYSSNVGFATIAMKLGWPNLNQYMNVFGFDKPTGIDLPDEYSSYLFPPSQQGEVQLATSGFGQGIAVTPLQQIAAIGAIANGGTLMKPYLAKAIISPSGHVVKQIEPTVVRRNVIPPEVDQEVAHTMYLDVSDPTAIDGVAKIAGYQVAGKTGTAQVVAPNGQYYANRFIVSFIGFAPLQDPQVEVYVTVDYPKTPEANTWGSTISAPFARDIMKFSLEYFRIPPTGDAQSLADAKSGPQTKTTYVETPSIVGETKQQAMQTLNASGLSAHWFGGSTAGTALVQRQWPVAGIQVPTSTQMYAWLSGGKSAPMLMPDLKGMSMREAGNMLSVLGVQFNPVGTGFASSQSIKPGQILAPGSSVTVTFTPPAN